MSELPTDAPVEAEAEEIDADTETDFDEEALAFEHSAEAKAEATPGRIVEAMIFASADPVDEALLEAKLPSETDLATVLADLQNHYRERGVQLVRVGKGWAFRTAPDLAAVLRGETRVTRRLSRAAVETLSIIAYHQPVTRAEIEDIRGVALSRGTLDALLEAGWIQPKGRRQTPGRPLTWGTTPAFLDHFGLADLGDLPGVEELKAAGMLDRRGGLTAIAMGEDRFDDDSDEGEAAEAQFDLMPLDGEQVDEEG